MNARAPRVEDFLELVQRGRRGRLKLYIGFAAGVGKTCQMLREAHALRARGVDVVLGFVETHGRVDTEALLANLPCVPRRRVAYRGVEVEELDLHAILARQPAVAVVDELAHTNPPDCSNKKRYQDVQALLAAGINVIGALNIQHLDSVRDWLQRSTGVAIRETVPERFLRDADQVVNLDLTVEDLRERLRAGKIYGLERIDAALENFFTLQNLSTLRELAMREVVESLERSRSAQPQGGRPTSHGRVLVCMSSYPPYAAPLLQRGWHMAGRLNTVWFVVYVQTPEEAPLSIDSESQRQLLRNAERARDMGAEFITLQGRDPVAAIADFARAHNVGHIIVGRSKQPWWRQLLGRALPLRLVRACAGIDLHIVSLEPGSASAQERL